MWEHLENLDNDKGPWALFRDRLQKFAIWKHAELILEAASSISQESLYTTTVIH